MGEKAKRYFMILMAVMISGMLHITAGATMNDNSDLNIDNDYIILGPTYRIEFADVTDDAISIQYGELKDFPEVKVYQTNVFPLKQLEENEYSVSWRTENEGIVSRPEPQRMYGVAVGTTTVAADVIIIGDTENNEMSKSLEVTVVPCQLETAKVEAELASNEPIVYDSTYQKPDLWISVNDRNVHREDGYSIEYVNNIDAGTVDVIVTGSGNYSGTKTVQDVFVIEPAEITCEISTQDWYYLGKDKEHRPLPDVRAGKINVPRKCLDLVYKNNINVGTAVITVTAKKDPATGIQNFIGKKEVTFEILPLDLKNIAASAIEAQYYTGKEIRPVLSIRNSTGEFLEQGVDYEAEYIDNINCGEAWVYVTGKGNYIGTLSWTPTFKILPAPVTYCKLADDVFKPVYTGLAHEPEIRVYSNDKLLDAEDYEVSYHNNIKAGEAEVIVSGKGNYIGNASAEFVILPTLLEDDVTWIKFDETHSYTGSPITPVVTVGNERGNLEENVDYTVFYMDNVEPGTATIVLKGEGNYQGNIRKTFTIAAPPASEGGNAGGGTTVPEGGSTTVPGDGSTGGSTTAPDDSLESEDPAQKVLPIGKSIKKTSLNGHFKVTGHAEGGISEVQYVKPVSKSKKKIVIPETFKVDGLTCKVTSIAKNAFKGNKKITSVTIGKNVTTIGSSAFSGCTKLSSVTIGSNVKTIGSKAFYKCTALKKITVPSKVTKINSRAFYGCKNLKSITIKTAKLSKKKVGSKAFTGINKKATIKVPKSKLKTYRSMLRARGVSKSAVIKK